MPPTASSIDDRRSEVRRWGARAVLVAEAIAWLTWVILQVTADNATAAQGISRLGSVVLLTVVLIVSFRSLRVPAGWHADRTSG